MPPPNFAVLLYRTVYFRFSRGLIAILPSVLGFFRLLAADISRKFDSIYPRDPRAVLHAFLAVSAGLTRPRPTCAFTT